MWSCKTDRVIALNFDTLTYCEYMRVFPQMKFEYLKTIALRQLALNHSAVIISSTDVTIRFDIHHDDVNIRMIMIKLSSARRYRSPNKIRT